MAESPRSGGHVPFHSGRANKFAVMVRVEQKSHPLLETYTCVNSRACFGPYSPQPPQPSNRAACRQMRGQLAVRQVPTEHHDGSGDGRDVGSADIDAVLGLAEQRGGDPRFYVSQLGVAPDDKTAIGEP